jgi:DNA-binding MarR family transcriptional regulator
MMASHYDIDSYSPRTSVGYLMRRGAALMRDELERSFARNGFTFAQWATLMMMREQTALTPRELCRMLHHDSGAFTRLLDQLEERGLLRRERSAADRRVVRLHLTAAGRRLVDSLLPTVVERLNHALEEFTPTEVATLTRLLLRLIDRLESDEARHALAAQKGTGP